MAFFFNGKETKEEEKLDFCPFFLVMKCAYSVAVCVWSPKLCFNESSGIKYHLQRSWADMLDCDICFKVALRKWCQTNLGCRSPGRPVKCQCQDGTSDSNNSCCITSARLGGWLDSIWYESSTGSWCLSMLHAWKKKQKNMYIKRAEANIACVSVCVREVSCWSLISIWFSSCCLNTFLKL